MLLSEVTYLPLAYRFAFALMALLVGYFFFQALLGHKLGKIGPWIAVAVSGTVAVLGGLVYLANEPTALGNIGPRYVDHVYIKWLQWDADGYLQLGFRINWLHRTMLVMVTSITFLVHLFSVAYMRDDRYNHRFWTYLALFSFAMCGVVLADNLLMVFLFWELMGLASYLLIGFWFGKNIPARASQKAFIVNRIGDLGFVIALMGLYSQYGTFDLSEISQQGMFRHIPTSSDVWIGLGVLLAVAGKSAQFPLQVWLPDAMAGPTPVSSLIHAATMVAAGVFLLIQVMTLLMPPIQLIITIVGCGTALIAAISALSQTDIKRVLAYSTISQLGFMVAAIGLSGEKSAFFHLVTHAFFKCGLFLTAGVIIHRLHVAQKAAGVHYDAQDLRWMGGLRKKMPLTFVAYVIFGAALAGLPFTSGFLSKDEILIRAIDTGMSGGGWMWLVPISLLVASFLTAFYITRHGFLIFGGEFRAGKQEEYKTVAQNIERISWKMAIPLVVLAGMSLWVVYSPAHPFHAEFGQEWLQDKPLTAGVPEWLPWLFTGIALLGIGLGAYTYRNGPSVDRPRGLVYQLSFQHFFLDNLYEKIIAKNWLRFTALTAWIDRIVVDGFVNLVAAGILRKDDQASLSQGSTYVERNFIDRFVNGLAALVMRTGTQLRGLQTGKLQLYLTYTLLGLLFLLLALFYFATA